MKPILIDALHICMGGGLMIMNHLVNNLVAEKVDFVLLKDIRCPKLQAEHEVPLLETLSPDTKTRNSYYQSHRNDFGSILCFGNVPPGIRMPIPVHTYMHNVNLLKIPADYTLRVKLLSYIKKHYIRHIAHNTDTWIVQTSNTASLIRRHLAFANQPILEYPFYYIPPSINSIPQSQRTDYIFVGEFTMAKGHKYLVEAWEHLARLGVYATLHLTVTDPVFSKTIEKARSRGANIVNHGHISFNEVADLYNRCKATVYPSLNESLGLGIIEAAEAGCDVIGCDLPYIHSVCQPSETFTPCNSSAIAEAVMRYEHTLSQKTTLKIKDEVKPFIDFLRSGNAI